MIERKNYVAQIRLEDQNNIRRSSVPARRALGLQRVYKFIRCFATIFSLCICSSVHFFAIYFHFLDTKILREKVSANQHRRDDIASRLENAEARSFSKAHSLEGFSHPRFSRGRAVSFCDVLLSQYLRTKRYPREYFHSLWQSADEETACASLGRHGQAHRGCWQLHGYSGLFLGTPKDYTLFSKSGEVQHIKDKACFRQYNVLTFSCKRG